MEREFFIKGKFHDLYDLLNIARAIGKRSFKVDRVNVKPDIIRTSQGYFVLICPENNGGNNVERGKNEGKTHKTS